ncbi:hypothetical protein CEXT_104141 [Caerostris extrusa]|uniref:Uncharacterized protein n=1 Tax=Caerostris extrusa TaxID=172846 RepID=A0AAV4N5X5_CAEEX|nr:hypothetical protein CEXT_104141 [Caerostris extrusa]
MYFKALTSSVVTLLLERNSGNERKPHLPVESCRPGLWPTLLKQLASLVRMDEPHGMHCCEVFIHADARRRRRGKIGGRRFSGRAWFASRVARLPLPTRSSKPFREEWLKKIMITSDIIRCIIILQTREILS